MKRVMIDLEGLSLRSDAAIVAIGVAISDDHNIQLAPNAPSYAQGWFIDPNLSIGHIDPKTVEWWDRQDETVQRLVLRGTLNPVEALSGLVSFLREADCIGGTDESPREDVLVYGDPAMYDLPVLDYLFRQCGLVKPWGYRQQEDARTIRKIVERDWKIPFVESDNPMPHHPVHDAITQLRDLNRLLAIVRRR